ncbi:MAG: glycosyl transferase family 1 [Rhodanobacteraceae bacterium]
MTAINLITRDNHAGLAQDRIVLMTTLAAQGHALHFTEVRRNAVLTRTRLRSLLAWRRLRLGPEHARFDVNLMVERVRPHLFGFARHNVLIPNPEWFSDDLIATLPAFDRVWTKTAHATDIFSALGCRTAFIGFSSRDRLDPEVARETRFLHVAGRSDNKGTRELLATWAQHPRWPELTVIWRRKDVGRVPERDNITLRRDFLADDELRYLQNLHRFHLCPSETEGYGHYLAEAASVGAVLITLDAAPMNELVTTARGLLLPATAHGKQGLATLYGYAAHDLAATVEQALALSTPQCRTIGAAARAWYEDNAREFPRRIGDAITALGV